jgi:diguanylate cyclase (GGDEF)-like protein
MIKNNKVHVLGGASINDDRLEYGYFTDETYFQVNYSVIGSIDNHIIIKNLPDIAKYRIGLIRETGINDIVLENISEDTLVEYFDTMEDALLALKTHEIDLITDNEAVFIEEYFSNQRFDFEILYSVKDIVKNYAFFTPKTKDGLKLSRILDKGMKEINMDLIVSDRYQNKSIFAYYKEYSEELRKSNTIRNFILILLIFIVVIVLSAVVLIKRNNNELEIQARTDHLTKLKNRNALFSDYKKREKLNNRRVYFIDLDDFKFINDNYGHDAGDKVLKDVSKRLSEFAPKSNVYRMGGDEFLLITEIGEKNFGEELLNIIKVPIVYKKNECKVYGSIGYIETEEFADLELHEIINLADYAMLEAKVNGKNSILKVTADMIERYKNFLSKKL